MPGALSKGHQVGPLQATTSSKPVCKLLTAGGRLQEMQEALSPWQISYLRRATVVLFKPESFFFFIQEKVPW